MHSICVKAIVVGLISWPGREQPSALCVMGLETSEGYPVIQRGVENWSALVPEANVGKFVVKRDSQSNLPMLDFRPKAPTGPLYHYTTMAGLYGIIKSRKLWATHSNYLNDPREISYALGLLGSCIDGLLPSVKHSELREALALLPARIINVVTANSYLACFTELDDSLVLWSTYTPNAAGIAIEFDPFRLSYCCRGGSFWRLYAIGCLRRHPSFRSNSALGSEL